MDAGWKARGKSSVTELYDLTSNPSEETKKFKNESGDGRLNCVDRSADLTELGDEMGAYLYPWADCIASDAPNGPSRHCDPKSCDNKPVVSTSACD
jgi:hypothetical protein